MAFSDIDFDSAIAKCKDVLKLLIEWCEFNFLYVNWSKTYVMFITNKRESPPSYIMVDSAKIEVVSKFKLLGVTIDSKLSFVEHASLMAKAINSKLFAKLKKNRRIE
jgi:ribonuclease HII